MSSLQPPPQTFSSADGTIQGAMDGINNLFTIGVMVQRARVWRNGILQTQSIDVNIGVNSFQFLDTQPGTSQVPHPSYPQAGDILRLDGWVLP